MVRDPNRCPTHPGVFINKMILPHVETSKVVLAKLLGMSRQQFYDILNGNQPINSKTAVRLEALFGRSAQAWLNMQNAYDVWHARQAVDVSEVPRLQAAV